MTERLFYVLPNYHPGSDEHFWHSLRFLQELSVDTDITVIIEKANGVPAIPGVREVRGLAFGHGNGLLRFLELVYLSLRYRLGGGRTYYVRTSQNGALPVALVARLTGGRLFFWHCGMVKEFEPALSFRPAVLRQFVRSIWPSRLAMRLAHYLVTGPERMVQYYHQAHQLPLSKIVLMYNEIDVERFKPISQETRETLRSKVGLSKEKLVILSVHRFSPVRRTLWYLEALIQSLRVRRHEVELVLIGGGPELDEARMMVEQADCRDFIQLPGSIPNARIHDYYGVADLFIMPSYAEGFPRVVLEAMAVGLPIVSTDAGGVEDIVHPMQRSYVVSRHDPSRFANTVLRLLDEPALRSALSLTNRAAVHRYSVQCVAEMFRRQILGRS